MPVQAMVEPVFDHQKRFQAAVDVIHNLPKNGFYRPSYEMMLRFYSLYKQALCGPCAVPRPGFWDPIGRYKWDAWSSLGELSSESAMAAYVDEIKKVAQEVIDTMPMNEKMAKLFDHFEPLYLVIDDMPRPPDSLFTLREGSERANIPAEMNDKDEEELGHQEDCSISEDEDPNLKSNLSNVINLSANSDSGVPETVVLNSDSESEIYCDSVDSLEQLSNTKILLINSNGFHNGIVSFDSSLDQSQQLQGGLEVRQVGAGQGGEGAEDVKGQNLCRNGGIRQEGSYRDWRNRGVPEGSLRQGAFGSGGAGQGGGYGSESNIERLHDTQLQQQIILALQRLREDMRSVMNRLEVVERLAAPHTKSSELRPCLHCASNASQHQSHVNSEEAENKSETPQPDPEEGPAPKRRPSALLTLLGKTFTEVSVVRRSASTRAEEELKKYLEAPPLSLSENPLSWWRTHETALPLLARQAKRYLCIPGTSVAAESFLHCWRYSDSTAKQSHSSTCRSASFPTKEPGCCTCKWTVMLDTVHVQFSFMIC